MIELKEFIVRSYDADFMDLFWTFSDSPGAQRRFHIFIEKSEDGPAGPWVQVAGPFFNTGLFRDNEFSHLHVNATVFYRLLVEDKESGESEEFGPFSPEPQPSLIAQELRRKFVLQMTESDGRRLIVFPRVVSGFRCPTCHQASSDGRTTGRKVVGNCVDCFDTTFLGGFGTPVAVFGQLDAPSMKEQPRDIGPSRDQMTTARLPWFPPIKPGDMIVEAENIRWEVGPEVRSTQKHRAIIHYEPVLMRIPPSDVRYKVPVNVDPRLEPMPLRELTRPMCLPDDAEDQIGDLGSFLDSLMGET